MDRRSLCKKEKGSMEDDLDGNYLNNMEGRNNRIFDDKLGEIRKMFERAK